MTAAHRGSRTSSVPADLPTTAEPHHPIRSNPDQLVPVPARGTRTGTTSPTADYYNMAALLSGDLPDPPAPSVMSRSDGVSIFYANALNLVFSDPESGKTWLLLCAMAEELNMGRRVLFMDLDHNGPVSVATRLINLGVSTDVLSDLDRFRYIEPADTVAMTEIIKDAATWSPRLVVIDSLGELLPMYRASSNSDDDFTSVHTRIIKPLVRTGAAVVLIDHLAKGQESRASGPTGAAAKRRAVDGVSLRVTKKADFVPGQGGTAYLTINKDRHGGLRANSRTDDREPLAAVFKLIPDGDRLRWELRTPNDDEHAPTANPRADLVAKIAELTPPPKSANDAHARLGGNRTAVLAAYKEWQPAPGPGTGTGATCRTCAFPMTAIEDLAIGQHLSCAT